MIIAVTIANNEVNRSVLSDKLCFSAKQITTAGDATGILLIVSIASLILLCKSQHNFNLTLLFRFPFSFHLVFKQSSYFPQNEISLLSQNTDLARIQDIDFLTG